MKKILLCLGDAYFINGRVGVGTYHSNIIWGLKTDYDIIVPDSYTAELPKNAHPINLSQKERKRISLLKWFLSVNFFFRNYDCIITDSFSFKKGKSKTALIMIVHDCMTFTESHNYTLLQKLYTRIASKTFCRADQIIAVSQTTKQTLHDIFQLSYNKINVIPNVTSFSINAKKNENFLYIGDMRKTKNLYSLISGFALYLKTSGLSQKLIITGRKMYEYESLDLLGQKLGISDNLIFTGYVSEEDKRRLFENTKAVLLLSDNEGFGIPLLEAAANSIPVICSDIPVFHEILDDESAIFVNNKDINAIAYAFSLVSNKKISAKSSERIRVTYSKENFDRKINELIIKMTGEKNDYNFYSNV